MALSGIENVYNLALGYIGEYEVEEGQTTKKQYKLCERYYAQARDECLVVHPWNEAMKRVVLVQDATNPIFGYDRRYSLPSDFLRIVSVDNSYGADQRYNSQGIDGWEVEGSYILSNAGETPPVWKTATSYIDGQFVTDSSVTYEVLVSHTSDTIANDLTAGNIISSGGDYRIVYATYIQQITDTTVFSVRLKQAIAMKLAIKILVPLTNDIKGKDVLINEFERLTMPKARSVDGMQGTPKHHFNSQWIRSRQSGTI